jgi:hypothetical protein
METHFRCSKPALVALIVVAHALHPVRASERWYRLLSSREPETDTLLAGGSILDVEFMEGSNPGQGYVYCARGERGAASFFYKTFPDSVIGYTRWRPYSSAEMGDQAVNALGAGEDAFFLGTGGEGVIRAAELSFPDGEFRSFSLFSDGLPPAMARGRYEPVGLLEVSDSDVFAYSYPQLHSSPRPRPEWKRVHVPEDAAVTGFDAEGQLMCCSVYLHDQGTLVVGFMGSPDGGDKWNVSVARDLLSVPSESSLGRAKSVLCTRDGTIFVAFLTGCEHCPSPSEYVLHFLRSSDAGETWDVLDTVIHGNPGVTLAGFNGDVYLSVHNDSVDGLSKASDWKAGVYVTEDSGDSWQPFTTGMTDTSVHLLKASNGRLLAATLGGNVFFYDPGLDRHWEEEWPARAVELSVLPIRRTNRRSRILEINDRKRRSAIGLLLINHPSTVFELNGRAVPTLMWSGLESGLRMSGN